MKKSILKLFALLLIFTALVVPVSAGGDQPNLPDEFEHDAIAEAVVNVVATVENTEVQPCVTDYCSECDGEMSLYRTIEGDWEIVAYEPCQYGYGNHTDVVEEKVTTIKYRCNNCGVIDTEYFTETRQYCR
ncbi:MAG: hypothetical protein IJ411_03585 [Oscillospiraceae bacterium]|nr:hypothetical protein [Oscillospiraceae bacterium]